MTDLPAPGEAARPDPPPMQQLTIYICEQDHWHGRPLYLAILELVRAQGGAGATVLKGLAGYSATSHRIHTSTLVDVLPVLPLVILVVDEAPRIARLLPPLEEMVAPNGGLLTVVDVVTHTYRHPNLGARKRGPPRVRDIMETRIATVRPDTPLADLLPLLLNRFYKALPVLDSGGRVLGMVTDGDLLEKADLGLRLSVLEAIHEHGASGFDEIVRAIRAGGKTARDVMGTRPEAVIGPDALVADAARLMLTQHVKRLPVVDRERRLLGIVARLDILKATSHVWPAGDDPQRQGIVPADAQTVGEVMLRAVPTVDADISLDRVVDALVGSTGARSVVVVDTPADRRVVGIITAADLVKRLAPPGRSGLLRLLQDGLAFLAHGNTEPQGTGGQARPARDIMTTPVITVLESAPLTAAIQLTVDHGVKVLPVTDAAGRLVGIVNRAHLLQALLLHLDQSPGPPAPTPPA
jgi:CBS domain-containing protein